jgi:hypothetical protein
MEYHGIPYGIPWNTTGGNKVSKKKLKCQKFKFKL